MNLEKRNKRLEIYIIPSDQALMKAKIRALKMGLVKACHERAFEEGEVDGDERAGIRGKEVVAVAYLEAA